MAETSWPFENADTTESQYSKLLSKFAETAVLTGLTITANTGMNINQAIGSGLVQGFYYENDSTKSLTVGAANATYARKDYVILKLDLAANSITSSIKAGTADVGGGTLPSLTQTLTVWEHPIAVITVPAGASNIVSGNIENRLNKTGLRIVPYSSTAERGWMATGTTPLLGVNTTTKTFELWDGTSWSIIPVAVTWDTLTGKPSTFTPSAHIHAIADVTNLQTTIDGINTAIAGKAPTSHTHTASQITDQNNINAGKVNGVELYVQASQPTSPAVNAIWMWG